MQATGTEDQPPGLQNIDFDKIIPGYCNYENKNMLGHYGSTANRTSLILDF